MQLIKFTYRQQVARMWLDSGDLVLIADSNGVRDVYEADGTAMEPKAPLAVLVNRGTASASEVRRSKSDLSQPEGTPTTDVPHTVLRASDSPYVRRGEPRNVSKPRRAVCRLSSPSTGRYKMTYTIKASRKVACALTCHWWRWPGPGRRAQGQQPGTGCRGAHFWEGPYTDRRGVV